MTKSLLHGPTHGCSSYSGNRNTLPQMMPALHGQGHGAEQSNFEGHRITSSTLHTNLLSRARLLLEELASFRSYLKSQKREGTVDIRQFHSSVQSETRILERIANEIPEGGPVSIEHTGEGEIKRLHMLRSSNLPFYEVVWATARKCEGVTALAKKFNCEPSMKDNGVYFDRCPVSPRQIALPTTLRMSSPRKGSIVVDVVADDGAAWIKVSTITEKRLLLEMAKEGWEGYEGESNDEHSDSDEASGKYPGANHYKGHDLDILRLAAEMKLAASAVRVRYCHPKVHFVLPKISEGRVSQIDALIDDLRKTGAKVYCEPGLQSSLNGDHIATNVSNASSGFLSMCMQAHPPLTLTLNIDCTILLALISDISHWRSKNLPPASNGEFHPAITRQLELEEMSPLLESELFPVMTGRGMRCTWLAARRMTEIVQTMGTAAEKARADILLGAGVYTGLSGIELCTQLKRFSDRPVPADLRLPISVADFDADAMLNDGSNSAPEMMTVVARGLSQVNRSVFLYGWAQNIVTISSNRNVAKEIERCICELLDTKENTENTHEKGILPNNTCGPAIWVCRTARSLIGKEKRRG